MKMLALSVGILSGGWGSAPVLLAPSVWLGCCWWGIVGLDSACEGTVLMFRVVLDFGCIVYEGFCVLSLSVSQLPSGVTNCKVAGLVCNVGLLPTALSPSFLDKGVGTGPTGTHLGAQITPRLLGFGYTEPFIPATWAQWLFLAC